jgi:tRNA(Arg) A34 adenosine deaminase TadA
MSDHNSYLDKAFEIAFRGIRNNVGGPFGAVIVKDGKIIGSGCNSVTSSNDPTAHAEVTAIRDACKNTNSYDLSGAEIYSTCEPCPMCFSAIYWANIKTVYFSSSRYDAADIGFRDNHIYEEMDIPLPERTIPFLHVDHPRASELFREWFQKQDKTLY